MSEPLLWHCACGWHGRKEGLKPGKYGDVCPQCRGTGSMVMRFPPEARIFRLVDPETGRFWLVAAHDSAEAAGIAGECGFAATKVREVAYFHGVRTAFAFSLEEESEFPERLPFG